MLKNPIFSICHLPDFEKCSKLILPLGFQQQKKMNATFFRVGGSNIFSKLGQKKLFPPTRKKSCISFFAFQIWENARE
jgi:hypothetical protein